MFYTVEVTEANTHRKRTVHVAKNGNPHGPEYSPFQISALYADLGKERMFTKTRRTNVPHPR